MCLTDLNHYKHSRTTIFEYALTQERIGTVFSGVRPKSVLCSQSVCVANIGLYNTAAVTLLPCPQSGAGFYIASVSSSSSFFFFFFFLSTSLFLLQLTWYDHVTQVF